MSPPLIMGNLSTRPTAIVYSPDRSKSHFRHGSSTGLKTLDNKMWIPVVKKAKKFKGNKKNLKKFKMTTVKTEKQIEKPKYTESQMTPLYSGMYNALTKTKTKTAKANEPEFITKTKTKTKKTKKIVNAKAKELKTRTNKKAKAKNEFNLTPLTQNLTEMSNNQLFSQILNHLILTHEIKKIRESNKRIITVPNKQQKPKKNKNKSTKRLRMDGNDLNFRVTPIGGTVRRIIQSANDFP